MANWGNCKDCQWWQIDPNASIEQHTMGMCTQPEIVKYQVRVAGISGCNHFQAGVPSRAQGAGQQPPVPAGTHHP